MVMHLSNLDEGLAMGAVCAQYQHCHAERHWLHCCTHNASGMCGKNVLAEPRNKNES